MNNFSQWFCERKEKLALQDSHQPLDVLLTDDADELRQLLSFFVMETRKEDGSEYTPKSLYLIVAGLQRVIRLEKGRSFSFNIFSDTCFESFHNVCDHKFRKLHEQGIGAKSQHVSAITDDDEKKLWDSNVLNLSTPSGLLNCVFFYNGKNLCLRGGDEHRRLWFSQFHQEVQVVEGRELVSYKYTEHGSKNHAGGLGHLHLENKTVCHFQVLEAGECDYIYILDLYFSKVPNEALEKDNFYLRPLTHVKEGLLWFSSVPIGRNKLATMVKEMCTAGGVEGNKTNHSREGNSRKVWAPFDNGLTSL